MGMNAQGYAGVQGAPIDMLQSWYAAHGWSHERLSDEEIIATVQGSWGQYELRGVWRDDDGVLQFIAFPDVRVTDDQFTRVYETIGVINEQLWVGHFELWAEARIIVFRHAALLDNHSDTTLSLDQTEILIAAAVDELDRFYPVFQFVLWGGKSPRDAIASALVDTHGEA